MTEEKQKQLGKTLWAIADQLCGALPASDLGRLRDLIGAARIRSDRDFASVLVDGPKIMHNRDGQSGAGFTKVTPFLTG